MKVGVPRETAPGERRVAIVPDGVPALKKAGLEVLVERGAGEAAYHPDGEYEQAGARLVDTDAELFGEADVVLKVDPPTLEQVDLMREGAAIVSYLPHWRMPELLEKLRARRITAFCLEQIPRITRAQSMDVLSSQATIAGYKAVIMAADRMVRILPMLTTAAGTLAPARTLVIGAGVAGLQAIGTAKRLGALVFGFDIRVAAAEQVESLGARFVGRELLDESAEDKGGYAKEVAEEKERRIRDFLAEQVREAHLVVTTAAIPRKRAPLLITEEAVEGMKPGGVIVDVSAESGGNCALTRPGEEVEVHGVRILGPLKLPAMVPMHASQMFSRNVTTFLLAMLDEEGRLSMNFDDEIVASTCVTHDGELRSAS